MENTNVPVISAKDLNLWYGDFKALKGISLDVGEREITALIGPSGCGKSTFLKTLNRMNDLVPNVRIEGDVRLKGEDIFAREMQLTDLRRRVGMVFQKANPFPMSIYDNITYGPKLHGVRNKAELDELVESSLRGAALWDEVKDRLKKSALGLSGGQQQRLCIARALAVKPEVLLMDEPLSNLDAKLRVEMRTVIKEIQHTVGITNVYVTHDQEEALTLSDTIVVMSEGRIQQIGVPTDIYNEPINSFVADFIGESNILNGVMIKDKAVTFCGHEFECVDTGFGEQMQVDVVIRPEDIYIFDVSDAAQLTGTVTSCIFKGVHYEMLVQTREGYELMVQDYHAFEAGREVGLLVKPFDIHVMKKERTCNTFEGKLVDETHVEFLGCNFECLPVQGIEPGSAVQVEVDFQHVILEDNEEDGRLTGEVKFILYKGNHYHLTVFTDWDEDIFVDTNDVWDDGDRVGITIAPQNIRIVQSLNKEGSAQ